MKSELITKEVKMLKVGDKEFDLNDDICLSYFDITSLPDNLSIGGSLYLVGCTGLTSLPDNLSLRGSLYLGGCTGLTSLPDNLSLRGSLYLGGCTGLTSLPDKLSVSDFLYLVGCNISKESIEKFKENNPNCRVIE